MSSQFIMQFDTEYSETMGIPKLILKNLKEIGIKPNQWYFYCLISYLQEYKLPIPSQPELGAMMGISERQVKTIIAELRHSGLLNVKRRKGYNAGLIYDFMPLFEKAVEIEYGKNDLVV